MVIRRALTDCGDGRGDANSGVVFGLCITVQGGLSGTGLW